MEKAQAEFWFRRGKQRRSRIAIMSNLSQPNPQASETGHLLIIGCSEKKIKDPIFGEAPAFEIYNGPYYTSLRKFLRENGWPPGLIIKIISAEHEIIDATKFIKPYNKRLDKKKAQKMNSKVLASLKRLGKPASVFVNLGKDYRPAIKDIETLFDPTKVIYGKGGIGQKCKEMKQWLNKLPNHPISITSKQQSNGSSYLYFFPDWNEYVYEPFEPDDADKVRAYAHEVFGEDVPYDGLLFSLAQLKLKQKPLTNNEKDTSFTIPEHKKKNLLDLREKRNIPEDILLFGDCGAFSYISEDVPPILPEDAATLYDEFKFDIGTSVDHIPYSSLDDNKKENRMELTKTNAEKFLKIHKTKGYKFLPFGSIQGIEPDDYARYAQEYIDMGYEHIAIGGLVRRQSIDILRIIAAVREAIQKHTRGKDKNIWIHIFGIIQPDLQYYFRNLGVSSFDSASYLRKAWASQDKNYLSVDGETWYGSFRVPYSNSKAMLEAEKSQAEIFNGDLKKMEKECLSSLHSFDEENQIEDSEIQEVLAKVDEYSKILHGAKANGHYSKKHLNLLEERPWKKCKCKVCQDAGIDIVVFRGAKRNRRRGFHNTWVFYHKILQKLKE